MILHSKSELRKESKDDFLQNLQECRFFFFKCPCASENLLFIFALGSDNSLQMYVMIREISLKGRGLSESLPPLAAFVCVYVSKKMACIIFL